MNTSFLKRLWLWIPLFVASVLLNRTVVDLMSRWQQEQVAYFFAYISSFVFFVCLVAVAVETIVWHNRKEFVLPFLLGFFVALWIGFILKNLFTLDGPFVEYSLKVFIPESGYSFPSLHAVQVFALLPLIFYKNKKIAYAWLIFCLMVGFSRVYLQLHYLSDVVAGAFIGYEVSWYFMTLEEKYKIFSRFNHLLKTTLEIRRQLLHTFFGCLLVFFYKSYLLTFDVLVILIIFSGILIYVLKKYQQPGFLHKALSFFERDKHLERFPARGIFFFMVGSLIALVLFPEPIALAGILILAFGDSITNIVGGYFGKRPIFYNKKKNWEGIWAGIFFATLAATLFVPLWVAFLGSTAAMLVESVNFKIGKIELDDNVLIPVVAGMVMKLLM